jgi:hypothetical protein
MRSTTDRTAGEFAYIHAYPADCAFANVALIRAFDWFVPPRLEKKLAVRSWRDSTMSGEAVIALRRKGKFTSPPGRRLAPLGVQVW